MKIFFVLLLLLPLLLKCDAILPRGRLPAKYEKYIPEAQRELESAVAKQNEGTVHKHRFFIQRQGMNNRSNMKEIMSKKLAKPKGKGKKKDIGLWKKLFNGNCANAQNASLTFKLKKKLYHLKKYFDKLIDKDESELDQEESEQFEEYIEEGEKSMKRWEPLNLYAQIKNLNKLVDLHAQQITKMKQTNCDPIFIKNFGW